MLCLDGVGEWATTTAWHGRGHRLEPLWEIDFPHSLGLLYSAFTYFTGFRVNSGEYKLMGLAPYGEPRYVDLIREHLIDIKPDGSFKLDMQYFNYCTGLTMTNEKFDRLFGRPPRQPESELTQDEMDIAASIQVVTEDVVLRLARTIQSETGCRHLCLAGGESLHGVRRTRAFDQIGQRRQRHAGGLLQPDEALLLEPLPGRTAGSGGDRLPAGIGLHRSAHGELGQQRGSLLVVEQQRQRAVDDQST